MGDAGGSYEHENENGDAIRNEDARDENSIVKILRSFDLTEKVIQRIRFVYNFCFSIVACFSLL